jgi:flagellar biosynthesis/type III secretory pathway protein FliH
MSLESPFVIRAAEVHASADAAAIRASADAAAAAMRRQSVLEYQAERARGRTEGLREGAEAAARLLAEAARRGDEYLEQREAELVELAFAIAQRIIADLAPDEALTRTARAALAEHRADARLTLRVAPDVDAALRVGLADDLVGSRIELETDPDLASGGCVLIHERGRTAIGIVDQFRALLRGVAAA